MEFEISFHDEFACKGKLCGGGGCLRVTVGAALGLEAVVLVVEVRLRGARVRPFISIDSFYNEESHVTGAITGSWHAPSVETAITHTPARIHHQTGANQRLRDLIPLGLSRGALTIWAKSPRF